MRPLRLELEGFAAFRSRTVVDLEGVDLAALVGPTGSGKSSLIDAVTFALYGSVARYDNAALVGAAVHQLAAEARVRLDFELGGLRYTAVRVVRRTKEPGRATTKEARLEQGETVLAGRASEMGPAVAELLGLDFAQFTRTVVLPQGDFARFLHDAPAGRQELLRRLLGVGIYARTGQLARTRAAELGTRADTLAGQLGEQPAVDDATVAGLAAEVAASEQRRRLAAGALERLQALEQEIHAAAQERDTATAAEQALRSVAPPGELASVAATLAAAGGALEVARAAVVAARDRRAAADAAVLAGPDAGECRRLLALHRRCAELAAEATERDATAAAAEAALAAATGDADAVRRCREAAAAAVRTARAARDEAAEAVAAGPDAATCRQLLAAADERDERSARSAVAEATVAALRAEADAKAAALDAAVERERTAADGRDRARLAAGAAGLVSALVVGEPCPVCRQTVAAVPDHDPDAELAAAGAAHAEAAAALDDARAAHGTVAAAHERSTAALAALTERIAELDALLSGRTRSALEADAARAAELQAAVAAADAEVQAAEAAEADLAADPEGSAALAGEREAADALAAARARAEATAAALAGVRSDLAGAPGGDELEADLARAGTLLAARDDAVAAVTRAEAEETRARVAVAAAEEDERRLRARFGAARDAVAALGPPPPCGGPLAEEWGALAAWAGEAATGQAELRAAAASRLERAGAEREELLAELAGRLAPLAVTPLGDLRERAAAAHAHAEAALAEAERRRAEQADLRERIEEARTHAAVAEELGRLLSAGGFERWLLTEAVDDLVRRATVRLRELSGGQYSFVADGTELRIRDHRNADEVRDAKTLSGGETFLASLALALALADSIADLAPRDAPRLESIFLDEGFGTLDPETLDVVAAAIEELGSAGRMVVIVTHIRDLADRMPVRFEVSKGPVTSTVERVER